MYTLSFQKHSLQAEENGLWLRSALEEFPAGDPGASNISTLVFLFFIVSLHTYLRFLFFFFVFFWPIVCVLWQLQVKRWLIS